MAAPPDRPRRSNCSPASPRSSTACGASSCSGPFLANTFPAVHDQDIRRRPGSRHHLRGPPSYLSLFNAALILAIMVLPFISPSPSALSNSATSAFYWITRASRDLGAADPRRHHSLADRRRLAGDEGIRLRLPVDAALGAVGRSAGARRARPDLRHAGHLRHRHADRHSGRPRHRDLPHRALPAMAAPPDRHRRRTARRHSLDHLRHVGLLRARARSWPIRFSPS